MDATLLLCAALVAAAPAEAGLASSPNVIVHAPNRQLAEGILSRAEHYRDSHARTWLGTPLAEGRGPVIIHVRISDREDQAGMLPMQLPQRTHHVLWLKTN